MNEKLFKKMIEHTVKLYYQAEKDELISGNSYIEFGDRSLQVLDGFKIEHTVKTNPNGKFYGKSPIQLCYEKMSFEEFIKSILGVELNKYQLEILDKINKGVKLR